MAHRVVWKIAAPMIGLGVFLVILGAFAAYNVHEQQQQSSEVVAHQAHAMLAIHELNIVMREIRHQVNSFLRIHDVQHLKNVSALHDSADALLERTKRLAREGREHDRIAIVEDGYRSFFAEFQELMNELSTAVNPPGGDETRELSGILAVTPREFAELTRMSDDVLTHRVMNPLEESLLDNRRYVEETNKASQTTAQHLKIGFLLLGICGGVAGLLLGTVIARTIGRSIVQLNVTVRGVAGRLSDVTGPVTISHTGDLAALNTGLRELEGDIAEVVERLQQRETELLRSEQLAKLGQLAAGVAHELRNPLTPMKILVQAAMERPDNGGLQGQSLQVLNDEIARLEQSIRLFLDFARPPAPNKTDFDIREVISDTLELATGRARQQNVEIQISLPDAPMSVRADRGQIRQLLLNLFLNALDALPSGGLIECTLDADVPGPHSRPAPSRNGVAHARVGTIPFNEHDALRALAHRKQVPHQPVVKWLAIRIADNGAGISADAVASIFTPFVTTKETGTGLGLPICRRIATDHDGDLTVRNRPPGGAELTLILPRSD